MIEQKFTDIANISKRNHSAIAQRLKLFRLKVHAICTIVNLTELTCYKAGLTQMSDKSRTISTGAREKISTQVLNKSHLARLTREAQLLLLALAL